jgi:hypothetical protein
MSWYVWLIIGWCGGVWTMVILNWVRSASAPLRCLLRLHDDGTDAFGGYSTTCLRCGKVISP